MTVTAQRRWMTTKPIQNKKMTPDGYLHPQGEIKRTGMLNKKVDITNSINTYLLSILF